MRRGRLTTVSLAMIFISLTMISGSVLLSVVASAEEPIVLWLSFDGVRHDALDPQAYPALGRIQKQGARAKALVPVFPSTTFANHTAMATGAHADRHGVVGNRFLDPELGFFDYGNDARFLDAEPLWSAAERQGVKAATFFWVGSETDWRGRAHSYKREPFDGGLGEGEKVDQILAWLDLPSADRPRLIMSWWHGADAAGHRHGPGSEEVRDQLARQDAQLARLLAGIDSRKLWANLTLILASDHGMTAADEIVDVGDLLDDADISARVVHGTSVAHVHLKDPRDAEHAVKVLGERPGLRAFPAQEVPESLRYRHPTRTGQVVVLADPPIRLGGTRSKGPGVSPQAERGRCERCSRVRSATLPGHARGAPCDGSRCSRRHRTSREPIHRPRGHRCQAPRDRPPRLLRGSSDRRYWVGGDSGGQSDLRPVIPGRPLERMNRSALVGSGGPVSGEMELRSPRGEARSDVFPQPASQGCGESSSSALRSFAQDTSLRWSSGSPSSSWMASRPSGKSGPRFALEAASPSLP